MSLAPARSACSTSRSSTCGADGSEPAASPPGMLRCLATTSLAPIMAPRTARHNQNTPVATPSQRCRKLWVGPRAVPARSAQKHPRMFARPQYPGVLAAAASWNDSRTGRLGQAPAASLPGGRLRMRLVIALSGPPQRAAAGQERLTEAVKRRAGEVLMALRGGKRRQKSVQLAAKPEDERPFGHSVPPMPIGSLAHYPSFCILHSSFFIPFGVACGKSERRRCRRYELFHHRRSRQAARPTGRPQPARFPMPTP
jgi:hypothetical protein